ncbi:uncharacterized protein CTHT_0031900 [Thermochaetoides thermophila DSM 1495]|uniref:NAD(P)-binding domain-containing protein n=1 Tax=Chaetomium thermophilum (strain DSM 1495 / CBS 144.50 / IMI 039719) TaxID=759272 RepID=G0S4W4_CHATD|nr:hypothetical protein CTHT_0031900 [Thermochaetoides thermophila DSM 1495]EGS21335.1 hypothetical protein CTHT_0031900 [Thermochaetoides thermophila DSM 1495]
MYITIAPASPKTGAATIRALLSDTSNSSLKVKGVYRDLSRVPEEFKSDPRFEAVKGNVEDAASIDFTGSDAVLNITPPLYFDEQDIVKHAHLVSENVKQAVQKAGVKRLVLITSVGAQLESGTGEILTNHAAEVVLKDAAPEVVFVRCAYFMENWASSLETVKEAGFFFSTITPLDFPLPMIAVKDIGITCAQELLATGTPLTSSPYIFELYGPREYSSLDVQKAFEEAASRSIEVRPVPKGSLLDFYRAVFPPAVAKEFTEMNISFLEGGVLYELYNGGYEPEIRNGKTELVEVIKELYAA